MALKDDLEKAKAALRDPKVKSYTYKGKKYSLTELRDDLIPELEKQISAEQKEEQEAASIIASSKADIRTAESRLKDAEELLFVNRRAFAKGNLSEAELAKTEQRVIDAQLALDALLGKPSTTSVSPTVVSKTNVPGPTVRAGVGQRPAVTAPIVEPDETETPTGVASSGDVTAPKTDKRKKKKKAAPTGVGPMGLTADVRAEFAKQFPEFASSLDGGEAEQAFVDFFGKDLIDLWIKVATTDEYDLDSDAGVGVYLRDVENTAYGQRTNEAQQTFDFNPKNQAVLIKAKRDEITKTYADLQLTESQLAEVAREAARNGYTGDDLRFTLYNFAYRGGLPTVTESALADEIRNIGRSYGYTVSEDKLKAALTGTAYNGRMVTKESLLQEAQAAAKGQFGHLADQIDSGLTLDDIFYNYRMFAAKTLGIDPNEIDYTKDPKWSAALGTKETGQMTLNDWTRMLKSDERYGWQFTDEANQAATKLVREMEKAFGFRK